MFVGLFYYTLGNVEPRLRSQLSAIHLVAVVRTNYIDAYGVDEILRPFVEDIKKLESVSCYYMLSRIVLSYNIIHTGLGCNIYC